MIEKIKEAFIKDFDSLYKLIGDKNIGACAILTDSDFITASLLIDDDSSERVQDHEKYLVDYWTYGTSQLKDSKTANLSPQLIEFLRKKEDKGKESILPLFTEGLEGLKLYMEKQ